jgi:hypothetical protein
VPVFISYQRVDESKARTISQRLKELVIKTYIDVMDPVLKSTEDVTKVILQALENCTHLLAVVSQTTVLSWWVPFEIGVATRGDRRIATFRRDEVTLPAFLKIWPVLDYDSQLEKFAVRYFQDSVHGEKSYTLREAAYKSIRSANEFHASLKRDLGQ